MITSKHNQPLYCQTRARGYDYQFKCAMSRVNTFALLSDRSLLGILTETQSLHTL